MHVFLSPHHDDICFSLSAVARQSGGVLINLFTRSNYTEADLSLPQEPLAKIEQVTALRQQEDEAFAALAGLIRYDLGLSEPPVRGISPFDLSNLRAHEQELSSRLMPLLSTLFEGRVAGTRVQLHCPMAIGRHRDHVGTLLSIRRNLDWIHRFCDLNLYEDLPYASVTTNRTDGLKVAKRVFEGFGLSRMVRRLSPEEANCKLADVALYASQHSVRPTAAKFTPASELSGAHEIEWRVLR